MNRRNFLGSLFGAVVGATVARHLPAPETATPFPSELAVGDICIYRDSYNYIRKPLDMTEVEAIIKEIIEPQVRAMLESHCELYRRFAA